MCDAMGEFGKAEKDATSGVGTWSWHVDEGSAASSSSLPRFLQFTGHSFSRAEPRDAKQAEILFRLQVLFS